VKIYINTDLEGVTGVYKFEQTLNRDGWEYREAVRLLMGDITAVVEGLKQAGVSEVYALDGHGGGGNFVSEFMVPGVKYITGQPRGGPAYGLNESFDGCILLGYHAMHGTPDGVLYHTQSSKTEAKFLYDGVERGEIYQAAVIAGYFDVPVIMVTGDEAVCKEARETLGADITTVAVKEGISREAAVLFAAEDTRKLLTEGAKCAVVSIPRLKPYKINLPLRLTIFQRRLAPVTGEEDDPYFVKEERVVRSALDIISGS
jgi:D-amino peptidase